jgi:hypothetical protein
MTLYVLVIVLLLLMTTRLTDLYGGGHYSCPYCGARRDDGHHRDCPWSSPPSPQE